ncbi:mucoidy inhibitor MuiA family protein [Flavobacteriales bacterium]|nr:mucoidy inhibitor MuiA family protein [Flavobacteriales bacterium]
MLQRIFLPVLCFLSLSMPAYSAGFTDPAGNAEKEVRHGIDHVTVYRQGAQIKRTASTVVPTGTATLVFPDLPTSIDPSQVRITGTGDFTILSVTHRYHTDTLSGAESQAERERLQKERNDMYHLMQQEQHWYTILDKEEQLLASHNQFTVKDSGVDLERLIAASQFMRERRIELLQERQAIDKRIGTMQASLTKLDLAMAALPPLRTETHLELLIHTEAEAQTSGAISFGYWMQQAGWDPAYNARVESVSDPLNLESIALVHQKTGEDWDRVNLSVSTGTPNRNRSKPNLAPWFLHANHHGARGAAATTAAAANQWLKSQPYNPSIRQVRGQLYDAQGQPLIGATVSVPGGRNTVTDINGFYMIDVPSNARNIQYQGIGMVAENIAVSNSVMNVALAPALEMLDEVAIAYSTDVIAPEDESERGSLFGSRRERAAQKAAQAFDYASVTIQSTPTQTRFDIDAKYSIATDGVVQSVRIKEMAVPAEFLYQATPKLDAQAYLMAHIMDWEELDLISGRLRIYFEDDFVGESTLALNLASDTLSLSLGPDPAIQVRRKLVSHDNKSNVITGKRELQREWEITVDNRKKQPIRIVIDDQLPLSNDEDVEVKADNLGGGKLDKDTGRVEWDFKVNPSERENIRFKYSVQAPKEVPIHLDS